MDSKIFKNYAEYYDVLYQDKDYLKESAYIHSILEKHSNGKHILEAGCGTGGHAFNLIEYGYKIEGIDLSKEMIEIANHKKSNMQVSDNLSFKHCKFQDFKTNNQFDIVLSLFHILSYQTTNLDVLNYLKTAHRHLKKGGIAVIDFWYGPGVLNLKAETRIHRKETDTHLIFKHATPTSDINLNLVNVHYDIYSINKINNTFEKISEDHLMRYFFLPELRLLTEPIFNMLGFYQWLTTNTPNDTTWSAVIILQKL